MTRAMDKIVILDFGSQYTQVIARRVRECSVYSEIVPYRCSAAAIEAMEPSGLILSGGPASIYDDGAPMPDSRIFRLGIPVLGICYGLQLMAYHFKGMVARGAKREYGQGKLHLKGHSKLFAGLPQDLLIWNSHGDKITRLPRGFRVIGSTDNSEFAAVEQREQRLFGLQFHPEVAHTPRGKEILSNFVHKICACRKGWTTESLIREGCDAIRKEVRGEKVILGLSGGVDSSVAAALLHKAIGDQLTCIFVNNGLLRKNEARVVQDVFGRHFKIRLIYVDAAKEFLSKLRGVSDPERKRKIIGREFIRVFERATSQVLMGRAGKHYKYLAQGTLYPDVIESIPIAGNPAALIKSHHNVGGLPKRMKFKLIEPLAKMFKDEVRRVGEELGLPKEIVWRQPFPGPGLAVRCLGPITPRKLAILREADGIVVDEMKKSGWYYKIWQSFAVLLPCRSVGVMGDERTYDYTIAIRAVESQDGMTADWVKLPYRLLGRISNRIINEVKGVNRVVFDVSSKPPATIEWE
jgi:GMP synthase (glutamine-hydrolysing)